MNEIKAFAAKIRIAAIEAIHAIGQGHIGGALSMADALAILYGREMRYDPKNPKYNGKCLTTHYRRIQGGFKQ